MSLVESYEQQYSVLTAELTANIGRLRLSTAENRDDVTKSIQNSFDEANDLLEQLELEVHGSGQSNLISRVNCYRAELQRIRKEFIESSNIASNGPQRDTEEYYDDWSVNREQQRKLLDNSEQIERTGKKLTDGYRVLLETEQIGAAVLNDLHSQRETIQQTRSRLRETDADLGRSSRLMNSMISRSMQQKVVLIVFAIVMLALVCGAFYFYVA